MSGKSGLTIWMAPEEGEQTDSTLTPAQSPPSGRMKTTVFHFHFEALVQDLAMGSGHYVGPTGQYLCPPEPVLGHELGGTEKE